MVETVRPSADIVVSSWLAHAASRLHRRRIDDARRIIKRALRLGSLWVSVSGGKDSVALLHLARDVHPDVPAWHIDSGAESPDALRTLDRLRALGHRIETCHPQTSIVEMARLVGAMGYTGPAALPGRWHWSPGDWKRMLITEPAQRISAQGNHVGHMDGVRADESRGRAMVHARHGPIHRCADGMYTIRPIASWTGLDSLAYAASHDLPIGDVYMDREDPTPPELRRTGTMLGGTQSTRGRFGDLKRRHPDAWRELVREFPRLAMMS